MQSRHRQESSRALRGVLALLALCVGTAAGWAGESSAADIAGRLDALKDTIAVEAAAQLKTNVLSTSYTTVWRLFEDAAIDALCEVLPNHIAGLSKTNFDRGKTGREKNRIADLAVICPDGTIEISIKAARGPANPENDLGTFREHPARKKHFAASFTLWVRYVEAGGTIRCDSVFLDRSWRFVGKSSLVVDGVKYRKKDGNMRPKPWTMFESGEAFWRTEAEFEAAVKRAEVYRANELIKEYLGDLSDGDQRLLYERLRQKFAEQSPNRN